jgi:hypothetical protein
MGRKNPNDFRRAKMTDETEHAPQETEDAEFPFPLAMWDFEHWFPKLTQRPETVFRQKTRKNARSHFITLKPAIQGDRVEVHHLYKVRKANH